MLVGLGNAGKTSLLAVRLADPPYDFLPTTEERTVGVEIRDIQLGPGPADDKNDRNAHLDMKIWDFAGQKGYYDTHQVRDGFDLDTCPGAFRRIRRDSLRQELAMMVKASDPASGGLVVLRKHSKSFDNTCRRFAPLPHYCTDVSYRGRSIHLGSGYVCLLGGWVFSGRCPRAVA